MDIHENENSSLELKAIVNKEDLGGGGFEAVQET